MTLINVAQQLNEKYKIPLFNNNKKQSKHNKANNVQLFFQQ